MISPEDREEIIRLIREIIGQEGRRRVFQSDIVSGAVKQRHVGEGVRFIRAGPTADKPTSGEKAGAVFYDTTVHKLYIWDGDSWEEEEFT